MFKITLDDICIKDVNLLCFSLHLVTSYDILYFFNDTCKIYYRGFIGECDNKPFFRFSICFIVSYLDVKSSLIDKTFPYLTDILLSTILFLLDIYN